jgi:hypothetical protein
MQRGCCGGGCGDARAEYDVVVGDRIACRWVTGGIDRWFTVTAPLSVDVRFGPGLGWHIMCDGYPYTVGGADEMVEVAT